MPERSQYQKDVIRRYYENRDSIDRTRLSELVTSLYLAEGARRRKLWEQARTIMERLEVPPSRIAHTLSSDDPTVLAEVVKDLEAGRIGS